MTDRLWPWKVQNYLESSVRRKLHVAFQCHFTDFCCFLQFFAFLPIFAVIYHFVKYVANIKFDGSL